MPLANGKKLGPYEVLGPLGAGGMGEVYRAKDTRLDRTVAVKVLPTHLSADADAKQRFDREARSVSSLAHPNICQLYDVGHQDGIDYLVMEFLEGETLAARILKGPLPTDQVLKVGGEICDGLEKAHKSGVVHRDLKPANIMLTKTGAKLMDFGLAKTSQPVAAVSDLTSPLTSPTPSGPLTQAGTIIGTFQYMSPEQVEGKEADARSDIFALGAVLYEMATGKRAFEGKTTASVIAAILEKEPPPISSVQPTSPPMLDRLVQTCLAKDPDERWQTAHDVKLQLQSMRAAGSQFSAAASAATNAAAAEAAATAASVAAAAQTRRNRDRTLLILGTALLTAIVAGALGYLAHSGKTMPRFNVAITLPQNLRVEDFNASMAFSPDGHRIAIVALGEDNKSSLWIRELDTESPRLLAGTDGASYVFWSPDGRSLGFFAEKKLKRVDVSNGAVTTVCDAPAGRGGTWNQDGIILFAPSNHAGLATVPASGGTPAPIDSSGPATTSTDRLPSFLPDGKRALFVRSAFDAAGTAEIDLLDLASKKSTKLLASDSQAQYVEPGYLVFARDGNLLAQPFNASSAKLSGEPVQIAQHVAFNPYRRSAQFSLSSTGLLLYGPDPGVSISQLTWYNVDSGLEVGRVGDPTRIVYVSVSPDDQRAAAAISAGKTSAVTGEAAIWLYDLANSTSARLTFSPGAYERPIWSPDGNFVYFVDQRRDTPFLRKSVNGGSDVEQVYASDVTHEIDAVAPDGKSLAISGQVPRDFRIDLLSLEKDAKPTPFVAPNSNARNATFSSDGKFMAYLSDETGRYELFVVSYPDHGGKWQISKDGVSSGGWLKTPNTLAFLGNDSKVYIVDIAVKDNQVDILRTRNVFGGRPLPPSAGRFDIARLFTRDGKRVLIPKITQAEVLNSLTLITDWSADLKKQ